MVKSVIRCENDMVIVFDEEGEQVPEYQGQYDEVKGIILNDVPSGTLFAHWLDYATKPEVVTRESW